MIPEEPKLDEDPDGRRNGPADADPTDRGADPPTIEEDPASGTGFRPTQDLTPPPARDLSGDLVQRLLRLGIATEEAWRTAVRAAGPGATPARILGAYGAGEPETQRLPPEAPLTPFQIERILTGAAESLRFGDHLLLDRVGAGGMGEVFLAWNLTLARQEAIKTIRSAYLGGSGSAQALARFRREARILAQLEHPGITTIYHAGRAGEVAYIAMEFVEGITLRKELKRALAAGKRLPVERVLRWGWESASALATAHRTGIVHRDIKPANLMLSAAGRVKVLDLGIARLVDPGEADPALTRQSSAMGTPEYMPPEQWADAASVGPSSDVYSLGCSVFELLAGRPPFEGKPNELMTAHLEAAPPTLSSLRPDAPAELDRLLAAMLAKSPAERPGDADEIVSALLPMINPPQEKPDPAAEPNRRSVDRRVVGAAVGLGVALAAAALAWALSAPARRPAVVERPDPPVERPKEGVGDRWMADFQREHRDVWPSLAALRVFEPDATSGEAQARIERETWRRRSRDRAIGFAAEHLGAWESEQDFFAFAASAAPEGIADAASYEEFFEVVAPERTLIEARLIDGLLLDRLRADFPELAGSAERLGDLGPIPEADLEALAETGGRRVRLDELNDWLHRAALPGQTAEARYAQRRLLELLRWGASLAETEPTIDVRLEATPPADETGWRRVEERLRLRLTTNRPGYVALFIRHSDGLVQALEWAHPIDAGEPVGLLTLTGGEAGSDRLVAIVAPRGPREGVVGPPSGVEESVLRRSTLPGLWQPTVELTDADRRSLEERIDPRFVTDRLDAVFEREAAPPSEDRPEQPWRPSEATPWGRATLDLRWVEPADSEDQP